MTEKTVLPRRRSRFAIAAAKMSTKHRRARAARTALPVWVSLGAATLGTTFVGLFAAAGLYEAADLIMPEPVADTTSWVVWFATILAPVTVWRLGRRATTAVPDRLASAFESAAREIADLAKYDQVAADRLHTELVAYVAPARHAVDLGGAELDYLNRSFDVRSRIHFAPDKRAQEQERARLAAIEANPVTQVSTRVDTIGATARAAVAVEQDKRRFADAPRRELEEQIAVEREAERVRELAVAFERAMNAAEALTSVHSEDIRKDAAAGRAVIARLTA